MCKPGNQTISKECYQEILRRAGKPSMSNKEARQILENQKGCMK